MRVPLSWLADFIELPEDVPALASSLSAQGLKVESIERARDDISSVVVAEVLNIDPHPNADRLILVDVRTGDTEARVVCGAHNFVIGDRVPYAAPGARLPGGFELSRKEVRGQVSDGMLCSAHELGMGEDHTGILVLSRSAKLGADVKDVLGLHETVIDFDITPNRPDTMSLLGVAREVSALTGAEIRHPETEAKTAAYRSSEHAGVEVLDRDGCPRYLARVVRGVEVGPSPDWVQTRLTAAGIRPVSNVVDATNYALLVLGHPMHAFDLEKLSGHKIVVRRAEPGEKITTLDGEERELVADDLVIADTERAVAIAGVMGGIDTEVSDRTVDLLLESAYFDPTRILRSSKRHSLRSEASARFERGTDPNVIPMAADYACKLIHEWAGGEVAIDAIDIYPTPIEPRPIQLRTSRVNEVLGLDLGSDDVVGALRKLDLEADGSGESIVVTAPTRRPDLSIEEDLIEEVARIVGYERIPTTLPSGGRAGALKRDQRLIRRVRSILVGAGLTEAYTSSFIGPADIERMHYPAAHPFAKPIALVNSLSYDESLLRPNLMPGLLAALQRNVARRNLSVRMFEVGHVFRRGAEDLPDEPLRLGLVMHGPKPAQWYAPERFLDFFDIKGVVETLLNSIGVEASFDPTTEPWIHPGRSAKVIAADAQDVGYIGEVSSAISEGYDLSHRAYLAELDLDALFAIAEPGVEVEGPARFPAVLLDLAVSLPEDVPAAAVLETAKQAGGVDLERVRIFDLYRGDQVGPGRKSLALSLSFRSSERTLTEAEAIHARDRIAEAVARDHGGETRSR